MLKLLTGCAPAIQILITNFKFLKFKFVLMCELWLETFKLAFCKRKVGSREEMTLV